MSACSSKEEHEWRSRLIDRSGKDFLGAREQVLHTSLSMNMKSMGTVFGKPGQDGWPQPLYLTNIGLPVIFQY